MRRCTRCGNPASDNDSQCYCGGMTVQTEYSRHPQPDTQLSLPFDDMSREKQLAEQQRLTFGS